MIIYQKGFGGFNTLLRLYGAPWPRALLLATPSTLLGILVAGLAPEFAAKLFLHPTSYLVFGSVMSLGLIFRTNLSYQRYWEGCTMIRTMTAKWADAAIQVIAFDEAAEADKVTGGLRFRSEFVHTMSLMHALALQSMRGDLDLGNLTEGSFMEIPPPPPTDPADIPGWNAVRRWRGIFFLRFDARHSAQYWKATPFTVIGGLNGMQSEIIAESQDRVFLVMCWILRMIGARRTAGGIKSEAPIISRIYQVLSDGMAGYENAYKLATTPFPFPFAQAVALLLHLNALVAPLTLARWAGPVWLVGVMSFMAVFSAYLLNEVAREIEEPFKFDPNDLPLLQYQAKFNEHLVTAFVKSLFPPEAAVFFSQIAPEPKMRGLVASYRPSIRRVGASIVDIEGTGSDGSKSARRTESISSQGSERTTALSATNSSP